MTAIMIANIVIANNNDGKLLWLQIIIIAINININ